MSTPPWGERLGGGTDGTVARLPADERPEEELADELRAALPRPEEGDESAPADSDTVLSSFVAGVRGRWLDGPRERMPSPGPVPSNRFA